MSTKPIRPEYATSNDACRYLLSYSGDIMYDQKELNQCMEEFDSVIDKAGGGNSSRDAQKEISDVCQNSCMYTNDIPDFGSNKNQAAFCYPGCILAGNIISSRPEMVDEISALDEDEKINILKDIRDRAKKYTSEYRREQYRPYSPFFEDSRTKHSKRVMYAILLVLIVGLGVFFLTRK